MSSSTPNLSFKDSRSLYGWQLGLTYERKDQVIYLRGSAIIDFYKYQVFEYNPLPDKLNDLTELSLSYGHRFHFKWGSLIPAIGLSIGDLGYRGAHTDTAQVPDFLGFGTVPVYHFDHRTFFYLGVPVTVRWLGSYKYLGFEFGAYCNFHKYADMGFTAAIAVGRITNYRRRKK